MSEFEGFEQDAPIKSEAEKRGLTREQAIEYGRLLAQDENRIAQTRGKMVDPIGRVKRAEAYAAWEYDGRLAGTIGKKL